MGPGKFLLRKTRSTANYCVSSCEGKPVGRPSRPSFRVPLRGRLTVLHCFPFARLPGSPGTTRDREACRLTPQTECFVAASDSWALIGVTTSAGACLGPLSDRLDTCRECIRASLGRTVARTVGLRPGQRSDVSVLPASFHEGRGPSLKDGLRPEPRSIGDRGPHPLRSV